jgi:hypothetical protein
MVHEGEETEIVKATLVNHESFNRDQRLEVIMTPTATLYRYTSVTLYRDYEVINEEKYFVDEDEAYAYWNEQIGTRCYSTTFSGAIPALA